MWFCFSATSSRKNNSIDLEHINENSFQNYAKFYGEIIPSDKYFDRKLQNIYSFVVDKNITDIKRIAELSFCTIPECVLKIRYLKNKRMIGDYYIDTVNLKLLPCDGNDQVLLEKYKPFIYGTHSQVAEIANVISNPNGLSIEELKKEILDELRYLDKKGLLNGLKIDDIDGEIIYYSLVKRMVFSDRETLHCPNCGALNDVDIDGKVRCSYCQTIIKGKNYVSKD